MLDETAAILESAGKSILLPAFAELDKTGNRKADGSVVTATDVACQTRIREALSAAWPDIAFLGEEMNANEQQSCLQNGGRYWCLDPLDGTTNFVASFPVFALSLALMENNQPQLACIHDPIRGETFTARKNSGAQCNGAPVTAKATATLAEAVGFVDFKRLDEPLRRHFSAPGVFRSQRNIGSCALEWAWLAAGRAQFIIHGGEKIWDYAAGALIAAEAGCTVSDFDDDSPFMLGKSCSPILATASSALHRELLAVTRPAKR